MIRILQVLGGLDRGGTENFIMYIYRNIDRKKIQFDFISHHPELNDFEEEISALGGKVYYMPTFRGYNLGEYKKAWHVFFQAHHEYKIIHTHIWSTASIFLPIAKQYGLYTVAHAHSVTARDGAPSLGRYLFKFPLRNIPDYKIACSEAAAKWVFGTKCTILPNAVDIEKLRFSPEIRAQIRKGHQIVLGHVGSFDSNKNQGFLIDVFNEVHHLIPDSVLWLIGDGATRQKLEQKAQRLGLKDSVHFFGLRDDIPHLLQAMDIFLFPSRFESFGNAALEAQVSGLPVICSTGVPRDVVATENVQFLPLVNRQEWVEAILQLIEEKPVRRDMFPLMKGSKFDVNVLVKWLTQFYTEQWQLRSSKTMNNSFFQNLGL